MEEFFRRTPSLSIDNGLLERSDRVGVVTADFQWDDVGAWDALYRTHPLDEQGNVAIGEAYSLDAQGCALYAGDGPLVAFGVEDLVIVRASGVTFVAHRDRVPELKDMLATLPDGLRTLS